MKASWLRYIILFTIMILQKIFNIPPKILLFSSLLTILLILFFYIATDDEK